MTRRTVEVAVVRRGQTYRNHLGVWLHIEYPVSLSYPVLGAVWMARTRDDVDLYVTPEGLVEAGYVLIDEPAAAAPTVASEVF